MQRFGRCSCEEFIYEDQMLYDLKRGKMIQMTPISIRIILHYSFGIGGGKLKESIRPARRSM